MAKIDTTSFEKVVDRVIRRSWDDLLERWLGNIPRFDVPATPPEYSLEKFVPLQNLLSTFTDSHNVYEQEVTGLREQLFHEALFLLHKAGHVIGAAESHAEQGMLTWSLSEAYQGALFTAQAILRFLGIATCVYNKKTWLIDIYPEQPRLSSKERREGQRPEPITLFISFDYKVEHRHVWQLFQRTLRVARFKNSLVDQCRRCFAKSNFDHKDFARQRNILHYDLGSWFFDDLYDFMPNTNFGVFTDFADDLDFQEVNSAFSMLLAMALFKMGTSIVESLAPKNKRIQAEWELMSRSLSQGRHPIFVKQIEFFNNFLQANS